MSIDKIMEEIRYENNLEEQDLKNNGEILVHKKRKRTKYFDLYINKALKQVSTNEITSNAKQQLNNLLITISKILTEKSLYLVQISKKKTLSIKEIENAIQILFIGDLKNILIKEGSSSVQKYKDSKNTEKKGFSRQNQVGIIFPPSICEKFLRNFGNSNVMITSESSIYLASVLEYLSAEILDLSSSIACSNDRIRITVRDLELAIRTDYEFNTFFNTWQIKFIGGGIIPFLNPAILEKKKSVKKKKKGRLNPGTLVVKEIKKLQKQGDCLIFAKHPFEQVIRHIFHQYKPNVKISKNVFIILQYYLESEMLNLIQKSYNLAVYSGRIKLIASDIEMVLSISENRLPNFLTIEEDKEEGDNLVNDERKEEKEKRAEESEEEIEKEIEEPNIHEDLTTMEEIDK